MDDGAACGHRAVPGVDARRRERRWFVVVALIAVAAVLASAVIGILVADSTAFGEPIIWLLVAVPFAILLVVGAGTAAFLGWRRRRGSRLFATSPLWELPRMQDRSAMINALRRGDAIAPEHRELALRVARDMGGRRSLPWLYVGIAAIFGVNTWLQDLPIARWFMLFAAVAQLVAAGYYAWLIRRMRDAADRLATDDDPAP